MGAGAPQLSPPASRARGPSALRTHLRLARASNLPTVWTAALAGCAARWSAQGRAPEAGDWADYARLAAALSLTYCAGMYLNDACDAEEDARRRPERPIPSGEITPGAAFAWGLAWLGLGAALAWSASGLFLASAVLLYNAVHHPVLMGLCRGLVYVVAGPALPPALLVGGYAAGLTWAAARRPSWTAGLVAALCLIDAGLLLRAGAGALAWAGVAGFAATLALQRLVRGD